jgi:gliding motility-associated-like protein
MKWILSVLIVACFSNTFARDIFVGGAGASDNNPGTATQPFATIQKAASVAVAGDVVKIRGGTYRETIVVANSGVTFENDQGATAIISGLNVVDGTGWTVHSGNIYKKSITLPVNGFNTSTARVSGDPHYIGSTIFANQILRGGVMMHEARWPNIAVGTDDLFDRSKYRTGINYTNGFNPTNLTDPTFPIAAPGLIGATLVANGWFSQDPRTITAHSGNMVSFSAIWDNSTGGRWTRERYYLTGKLALLDAAGEWHYESGTLYFYQPGGGTPTGTIEYKARNYGFDGRGKSNITIKGLTFIGCDPYMGDRNSANTIIDNIRASYMSHHVRHDVVEWQGVGMSKQFGTKLLGPNSVVKNSEFSYSGSSGVWLGANCRAENNLMHDMGYVGYWANPISLWANDGGQVITRNTIYKVGRSAIDFGYNFGVAPGTAHNFNVEISYNDMSDCCKISSDCGATYTWGQKDLVGLNYHHNWIHDVENREQVDGGINCGIYFDQATGPGALHHNVVWNAADADMYHETTNDWRPVKGTWTHPDPMLNIYNNTFATSSPAVSSYRTYATHAYDVQRNNIYRLPLVVAWQPGNNGNNANAIFSSTDPQFVGTGQGGLKYRLRAGSPAINTGLIIPGYTDGSVGAPDIGAYEFGGPEWIPGYTPVPTTTPVNTPPTGSITAPSNNTSFGQGAPINITATAADANGTVTRVEFFDGTTKLGEDTSSPYSFNWTNAAAGTHTLTIRVTDNENATATSTAVTITVTANASPTVSITAPANNAQVAVGTPISITATAADANGSVTKVEFFDGTTKLGEDLSSPYTFAWTNAVAGAHVLTAKATDDQNNVTTSTAVNITVTAGNTPPTVSITSPSNNAQFAVGAAITITATAADANGSVTKVEFFNGTTKLGEDLTSPYTFAWNGAPAGTYDLTAKATDNGTLVTTSTVIKVTVKSANHPSVRLTKPGNNNARFVVGSSIDLSAEASDADGTVTKVEFFSGTTKLGEDLTSPYNFIWNNATVGTYSVTAKATDNETLVTTSTALNVIVDAAANTPPVVSLTAPANNTQFTPGSPITLTATASDPNGTVTKVEFFDGTTKLGEDLTSPYSFAWSNAAEGSHVITVKATDNGNVVTTSAAITITVTTSTNTLPVVSITAPLNNAQFANGNSITISATASDANGTVTKVEFFDGTTKIGEDLTSPYNFIWTSVSAGTHAVSARATDNLGGIGSSTTISITVDGPASPVVEAGENVFLTLPENSLTMNPTISSDGPVETNWTQVEGPNTASMSDPNADQVNISDLIEGTYVFEISVTNASGIGTTDLITITVTASGSENPALTQNGIPRFFSPNDDGTGDYWDWENNEAFENSLLTIFNRSGQKIYEAFSYNDTWDGKMDGQPLQPGDYYYVIKMEDLTDLRGAVRIVR